MNEQSLNDKRHAQRRTDRKVLVILGLTLMFIVSTWNWLYNIPVEPNVEIPKSRDAVWTIDAAHPTDAIIWEPAGPATFYTLRTGEKLLERHFDGAERVSVCPGNPRTTLVRRNGLTDIVDLRENRTRARNLKLTPGSLVTSAHGGEVLLVHRNGTLQAFNADTGEPLWSRDRIDSVYSVWSGEADVIFIPTTEPKDIDGKMVEFHNRRMVNVNDGQPTERFAKFSMYSSWINYPPRYLAVPEGRGLSTYDLATGKRLSQIEYTHQRYKPYYSADATQILWRYREPPYGCRLARWDAQTGKVIDPIPKTRVHDANDLVTDDGRYSIGEFVINIPPGYELIRQTLLKVGIPLPAFTMRTHLVVDNESEKVLGRMKYSTRLSSIEVAPGGDAFIQTCDDRLAIYFLPIRVDWARLVLGGTWVVVSFGAMILKLMPLIRRFLGDKTTPEAEKAGLNEANA